MALFSFLCLSIQFGRSAFKQPDRRQEEAGGAVAVADGKVAAASRAGKDATEEEFASTGRSRDQGLDKERTSLWLSMKGCRGRRRGSGRVGKWPPGVSGPDTGV